MNTSDYREMNLRANPSNFALYQKCFMDSELKMMWSFYVLWLKNE